jgi:hypothetical protein
MSVEPFVDFPVESGQVPLDVALAIDGAVEAAVDDYDFATCDAETDPDHGLPHEPARDADPQISAEALATELSRLVDSVAVVEELSRNARESAATDLAQYETVLMSVQEYRRGLEQASAIRDQSRDVLDRAFGYAARAAAEPLLSEAERVLAAFAHLVDAWNEQADGFLGAHPDVDLLLAEQRAQEQQARQREAQTARQRRHEALLAGIDAALGKRIFAEVRRGLAALEREFPEDPASLLARQGQLDRFIRAQHDDVAREAMLLATEQQSTGDLDGAVGTLEHCR